MFCVFVVPVAVAVLIVVEENSMQLIACMSPPFHLQVHYYGQPEGLVREAARSVFQGAWRKSGVCEGAYG